MKVKLDKIFQICLVMLLLTGCSGQQTENNYVRIRLKEDPTTLDPAYIVDVSGGIIAAKLYNGLVRIDEKCKLIPDIAESWQISDNGLIYTFKLRNDVKLSNGKKVTANDFLKCYQRILSPQTASPRNWIFDKVKEFKVVSGLEFQIVLKEPFAPFLYLLCLPNAYLVVEDNLGTQSSTLDCVRGNLSTTGPYIVSEWQHDNKLILEPNRYYFGERAKVPGIEYLVIPDNFTAKTEFELGNLDIMEVAADDWSRYHDSAKWPTYSETGLNTYYLGFNCQDIRFRSCRLRQALNHAVDKETIIKHLLQGQAQEARGPVPPVLLENNLIGYKYLPNKAKRLLQQSGVKFEQPIKLYVRAQKEAIRIAESIQHYLNAVGLETRIIPLEWSAYKEKVAKGEADLFLMSWWADYPSAENFLFPTFHSSNWGSGGNRARFKNLAIDRLIEKSQAEMDIEKRTALYRKIQRAIVCQAPWLFLWHKKDLAATQPWIKGMKLYPVYNSDKGTDVVKIRIQD